MSANNAKGGPDAVKTPNPKHQYFQENSAEATEGSRFGILSRLIDRVTLTN